MYRNSNLIDSICVIEPYYEVHKKSKLQKRTNLITLIISLLTKYYPEIGNLPENRFIRFQDELSILLNNNIDIEEMK